MNSRMARVFNHTNDTTCLIGIGFECYPPIRIKSEAKVHKVNSDF